MLDILWPREHFIAHQFVRITELIACDCVELTLFAEFVDLAEHECRDLEVGCNTSCGGWAYIWDQWAIWFHWNCTYQKLGWFSLLTLLAFLMWNDMLCNRIYSHSIPALVYMEKASLPARKGRLSMIMTLNYFPSFFACKIDWNIDWELEYTIKVSPFLIILLPYR